MEYNTKREKLIISEYGRNFQKIILEISKNEDKEVRSKMVERLVDIISAFDPEIKLQENYKHTLYDHIHIMSDYTLDIDSPYPAPTRQERVIPDKPNYNTNNIKLRPYGKNIQKVIEEAVSYEDGIEKEELVKTIANNLKKMYLNWNRDSVDDNLIHEHLELLSDGKLKLREEDKLKTTSEILKTVNQQGQSASKTNQNSQKKNRKKKDNHYKKRSK